MTLKTLAKDVFYALVGFIGIMIFLTIVFSLKP